MANQLIVGQKFVADVTPGVVVDLIVTTNAAKYTFVCGGTAEVLVGVYKTVSPVGTPDSSCRICGVGKIGTRMLVAGDHLVRITPRTAGSFEFTVKPYNVFRDWVMLQFKKSSC